MRLAKEILIGFVAGGLMTGGALGAVGYLKIHELNAENSRLEVKLKKSSARQTKLTKTQASLQSELESIKQKKGQAYDETIDTLIVAKENAGVDALYEIGSQALREKDYPSAYYALSQVEKAKPDYKEIARLYPESQKAYEIHKQKTLDKDLSSAYAKAYDHQLKGQFAQAKDQYQRVVELKASYKDAKTRLTLMTQLVATTYKTRDYAQKKQWLDNTYKLAVNEQALGRWAQARDAFASIVSTAPGFKDSAKRLNTVSARLPKAPQVVATADPRCYEKGVAFANCAKDSSAEICKQYIQAPPECKGNPEFQKGMGSVTTQESLDMIKGLPDLLKSL